MRPRSTPLVVAITLLLTTLGAPRASASVEPPDGSIQTWAPENSARSHKATLESALAASRSFNLITPLKGTYRKYVADMKAANPDLLLLSYMNGSLAQHTEGEAFPEGWYIRDETGAKIRSLSWGNYLMNPSHPGWIENRVQHALDFIAFSGYDGVIMDVMGTAPIGEGYTTGGAPINPATGGPWTQGEWLEATASLAAKVKQGIAPKIAFVNGLGSGRRYFNSDAPTSGLLDGIDGAHAEAWLRNANAPVTQYPNLKVWKENVDMLVDATNRGKTVLTLTKVWSDGTEQQKESWHSYALASYLLGANDATFFSFSYERDADPMMTFPQWDVRIGAPLGAYYEMGGGGYRRDFSGGSSLVNPTDGAISVDLGAPYITMDGATVTSVTMEPNQGQVLVRAS